MPEDHPRGFSPNFQREGQTLYLHQSVGNLTRKEVRANLAHLGVELFDEPIGLPQLQQDDLAIPQWAVEVANSVGLDQEILLELPVGAFQSQDVLLRVMNELMIEMQREPEPPQEDEEDEE